MNYLPRVNPDAAIMNSVPLKYVIFCYLCSEAFDFEEDNAVYSKYNRESVTTKFKHYSDEDISEAFEELKAEGLISIVDGDDDIEYIAIGVCSGDGLCKLFGASETSLEDFIREVNNAIASYIADCSGVQIAFAKKAKDDFEVLSARSPNEYKHYDFVKLFLLCFEVFLQERPREFMEKEHGQLKQLRKAYDAVTLFKMIVYYFANSNSFGKYVNLNTLVYKKDEVYQKMKGVSKKRGSKSHMRTKRADDDDGF